MDITGEAVEHVIEGVEPKICDFCESSFRDAEADDSDLRETFDLLADVCTFDLKAQNHLEPFGPELVLNGRRSIVPTDLSEEDVEKLKYIGVNIVSHDLRARLLDTVWVVKRDPEAAREAVLSYVTSGMHLLAGGHGAAVSRIERALRLHLMLGGDRSLADQWLAEANSIQELSSRFKCELLELRYELRVGDPEAASENAGKAAREAIEEGDLHGAGDLFEIKAGWDARRGAEEERREALREMAEIFARIASQARPPLFSAHWMEKAVALLQSIGERERAAELHRDLIHIQGLAREQMGSLSGKVDLTDVAREAEASVRGKGWPGALFQLALVSPLPEVSDVRADVERELQNHPLLGLMPHSVLDADGRVIYQAPAALGGEDNEKGIYSRMCRRVMLTRQLHVDGLIIPALRVVVAELPVSERVILRLVRHSPFVPPRREVSFARGLAAGFAFEFLTSTHLLLPQVESSFRHILQSRGVIVRGIQPDGTQELYGLGRLLSMRECSEVFGEDLVFDCRSLLTEPAGDNLRNHALHGIEPDSYYEGNPASLYLWWLTLRCCLIPLIPSSAVDAQAVESGSDAGA